MSKLPDNGSARRREPITDTQLLLTITICIFVGMYVMAMLIWGGGFKKPQMIFDILNDNAYLIIISCGLTIVMITGSIDISVGGVTALVAMVGVMILNGNLGLFNGMIESMGLAESWRIVFALLMSLLIGLAFGAVQGFLIAHLEIQPFIITLAGMFFARGMITIVSVDPQKAPQSLMDILQKRIEIPWLGSVNKKGVLIPAKMEIGVVIALVIVVLVFLLLRKHALGRSFYAVGGNRQSALMLGVNVRRTRFMAHLLCGLLSGIAGFVFMMHTGAGNATNATAAEMNAIASSIIGGTLLTGGVGSVIGTFFGVLTLSTIKSIVTTAFTAFFVIEPAARTVTKLTVTEPAVATVVIKSALTSRLVAKTSLFVSFLVTVTVIEFEGLSLLEHFWFVNRFSGARTLARSFVVSHL